MYLLFLKKRWFTHVNWKNSLPTEEYPTEGALILSTDRRVLLLHLTSAAEQAEKVQSWWEVSPSNRPGWFVAQTVTKTHFTERAYFMEFLALRASATTSMFQSLHCKWPRENEALINIHAIMNIYVRFSVFPDIFFTVSAMTLPVGHGWTCWICTLLRGRHVDDDPHRCAKTSARNWCRDCFFFWRGVGLKKQALWFDRILLI